MGDGEIAMPGDSDLDFDVDGVVLTSCVRLGGEFIIGGAGGSGIVDGKPWTDLAEFQASIGFGRGPQDAYEAQVLDWIENATPITVTLAPGRMGRFCAPDGSWLPVPRSPNPNQDKPNG